MERGKLQGYVAGLEQVVRNTHLDLCESMTQFQELCHWVNPERMVTLTITSEIRKTYKEVQDLLAKIRNIVQLLESKYRMYYRRDFLRDREIIEIGALAKQLYTKFEFTLLEIEAKRRLEERGQLPETPRSPVPFTWFQSTENQVVLLRNLRALYMLEHYTPYYALSGMKGKENRRVIQDDCRSVSLFVVSGEASLIQTLHSRMRLREFDIKERTGDELRGALTHLREISSSQVEGVMKRFMSDLECSPLKGLLFPVHSPKDLQKGILSSAKKMLDGMREGELKTISI